jgi:hypothetical protein
MSGDGGDLRPDALSRQGEASVAVLPTTGASSNRPRRDGTHPHAEACNRSVPARADEARSIEILDQILAAAAIRPTKTHSGWAPDRLWDPDPLEDFALS